MIGKGSSSGNTDPAFYLYRQRMGDHVQTGIVACVSIAEYEAGRISRHELTREDKEKERTLHIDTVGAQTGPVFLTYRGQEAIDRLAARSGPGRPSMISPPTTVLSIPSGSSGTRRRSGGRRRDLPPSMPSTSPTAITGPPPRQRSPACGRSGIPASGGTRSIISCWPSCFPTISSGSWITTVPSGISTALRKRRFWSGSANNS